MATDYDQIAGKYKRSKQQAWRWHIECFTLLGLTGDLAGHAVLDLACGSGFYSRILKLRGAARVVGIDLSQGMIDLAREEEARSPLGVEYRVGDAREVAGDERFDLVTAAYLLNYAQTKEELIDMCRVAAHSLKPGGRFVGVNNNPAQPPEHFADTRKYGFVKRLDGDLREGAPVIFTIALKDEAFDIVNYHLSLATHEEAFRTAGFGGVRWHPPRLAPAGEAEYGKEYWDDFLANPAVTFFEATKPNA